MGSILFLASWAVLMGPIQYAQHLISGPRLPFTAAYFGSIALTLVFAIKVCLSLSFIHVLDPALRWDAAHPSRVRLSRLSKRVC